MQDIPSCINGFESVTLEELDRVELQNRLDTKYLLTVEQLIQLLDGIRQNQYVLEIDGHRIFSYQTIYFDTADFQFYKDHHNGCVNRVKVRSRAYLESSLAFYEIKRKLFGTRTDKQRKRINSVYHCIPDEDYQLIDYRRLQGRPVEKKLTNNFKRITLTNKMFTERITIDFDIHFDNGIKQTSLDQVVVVEVKQGKSDVFSNTIQVLKSLRVHESSFSKYAIGVSLLEQQIKHNNFKPILLAIQKINTNLAIYGTHG